MAPVGMKTCAKCGEIKTASSEFFYMRNANNGRTVFLSPCIECRNSGRRAQRADTPRSRTWRESRELFAQGLRRCTGCKGIKPATTEYFKPRPDSPYGLVARCRDCQAIEATRYRASNPSWRKSSRTKHLMTRYNMTLEQYESMLEEQGGVCAVKGCGRTNGNHSMHVDHDHSCCPGDRSCGKCVRGLLCGPCNKAAGMLREDPALMMALADYVLMGGFRYDKPPATIPKAPS